MNRSLQLPVALVAVICVLGLAGCPGSSGGPATVPVKGTLTIDGEPANNILITFQPTDASLPPASGQVSGGAFELFSGVEGKAGAVPGKYKVVLAQAGASLDDAMAAMQKPAEGGPPAGGPSAAPGGKPSFPDKYLSGETSDKEVEVTSGSNDIKIEISGT